MTKTQQRTITVGSILILALVGAGFFGVISPQWSKHKEASTQAESLRAAVDTAVADAASLRAKAESIDTAVSDLNEMTAQFPPEIRQDEWFTLVVGAATKAGVTVKSISPSIPQDPTTIEATLNLGQVQTLPTEPGAPPVDPNALVGQPETVVGQFPVAAQQVAIIVNGGLAQHIAFLDEMNRLTRPFSIRGLRVQGDEMTVTGRAYLTRPLTVPESLQNGGGAGDDQGDPAASE